MALQKTPTWREPLMNALENRFSGQKRSRLYGVEHALTVETQTFFWIKENNLSNAEEIALRAAALLHDIGFSARSPDWAVDGYEHIRASLELADEILRQMPFFSKNTNLLDKILSLICFHDETTYSFPTATLNGQVWINDANIYKKSPLLPFLKEADALAHSQEECITEAMDEWLGYDIPPIVRGLPLATWCWHNSIVSNLRLFTKRVILDSLSEHAKKESLQCWRKTEKSIKTICAEQGVPYEAEICSPRLREASVARSSGLQNGLRIKAIDDFPKLTKQLRSVTLLNDKDSFPYEHAQIELKSVRMKNIQPMAYYVMRNRLEETLELYDALMAKYCLGLWDLPGILTFTNKENDALVISPPLIEVYNEKNNGLKQKVTGLVDGLHRCTLARRLGFKNIRALCVKGAKYPLVPLPTQWERVKIYEHGQAPENQDAKRPYRFSEWTDVPDRIKSQHSLLNEKNFRYFFYRDLHTLGSKGKRDFHGKSV